MRGCACVPASGLFDSPWRSLVVRFILMHAHLLSDYPCDRAGKSIALLGSPKTQTPSSVVGDGADFAASLQLLGQLAGQQQLVELLILLRMRQLDSGPSFHELLGELSGALPLPRKAFSNSASASGSSPISRLPRSHEGLTVLDNAGWSSRRWREDLRLPP